MTNQQTITILAKNQIHTIGDLDAWARARRLSRWEALSVLVGVDAANLIIGLLAVNAAKRKAVQ